MAAVYSLDNAIAQAQQAPVPPPVSTAQANPLNMPAHPASYAIPGIGGVSAAPPVANPNDSPFAQALAPYKMNLAPTPGDAVRPGMFERAGALFGTQANNDDVNQRVTAANILDHPEAQNIIANSPAAAAMVKNDPLHAASTLQPLLAAMAGTPNHIYHANDDGTSTVKQVPDPAKLAIVAAQAGVTPTQANPLVHHDTYTRDEFINATKNLTWNQAAKIFGTAQRLTPQQQITNQYGGVLHDNAAQADAAYKAAVAAGKPKGVTDALALEYQKAQGAATKFLQKGAEGQLSLTPDTLTPD